MVVVSSTSERNPRLRQNSAANLKTSLGLGFQSVERLPTDPVSIDDVHLLKDFAFRNPGSPKLETPVTVDRSIAIADHVHEGFGIPIPTFYGRRSKGVCRCSVVTAEGSFLGSDDGLSRRDVFGCACECRAN